MSNLLQTSVLIGNNELADFKTFRHYWLMGGYRFELSDDLELEPSTLLKTTENWNPQGDFSLKLYYSDLFWGGLSYRTNKSIVAIVGVRVESSISATPSTGPYLKSVTSTMDHTK